MRMKEDHMKNGQLKPAYNLQLAVTEYIIGLGLSRRIPDLIPFLTALESEYGRLADHIVADAGYDSEEKHGLDKKRKEARYALSHGSMNTGRHQPSRKKIGHRSNMAYDADSDTYCAKGRKLHFVTEKKSSVIGSVDMNGPYRYVPM